MNLRRALSPFVLAALLPLVGLPLTIAPAHAGVDAAGGVKVDTFGSMDLLLPTGTVRGGSSVSLTAAKNEYESFQIKVSAGATALQGMSVSLAGPLQGPGGATLGTEQVRFYREDYYKITTMSDGELAAEFPRNSAGTCVGDCRIPDALIPERDLLTNQDRAAFPVTVPAGENRVAWVDVLVPSSAVAGTYRGSVEVRSNTGLVTSVPLSVEVLNATLPSTTTMKSQVYVNYNDIGRSWATYQQLAQLGLANRITIVPDGFPTAGSSVLGPLLNGTDPKVPLPGARLTSFPLTRYADTAAWRTVLTQYGKADLARFWCDEIDTATCTATYDNALKGFPGLRLQQIPKYLKPTSDPTLLDPRAQTPVPIAMGALDSSLSWYQQWRAKVAGRELWAYTSCMQASCTAPYITGALYTGTPGLGIDQPTSQSRAMGWHGFRAQLDGEHYWTAAGAYARSWNACTGVQPTNCQYTAAGEATGVNGDGNLFYAWNQAKVGGTTPIAVESLRLKRFRDGREDNELMQLLAGKGKGADARAVASSLFPSFAQSTRTPAQVATARAQLESLVRATFPEAPATPTPTTPTPVTPATTASQDLDCDGDADLLGVGYDGRLLLWGRKAGDWDPAAPTVVGTGWLNKYRQLVLPGDVTGDSRPDLLGVTSTGALALWKGACGGAFTSGGTVGTMTVQDAVAPGDFDGDGRVDVLDRRTDGTLWLASGNGAGGFGTPRQVGSGWSKIVAVGAGDVDRDGANDVLGRAADGRVLLYRGNGRGGWVTGNGEPTGLVLAVTDQPRLLGPGDMGTDGRGDLVALTSAGQLTAYAGNGTTGFATTGVRIGSGWTTAIVQIAD